MGWRRRPGTAVISKRSRMGDLLCSWVSGMTLGLGLQSILLQPSPALAEIVPDDADAPGYLRPVAACPTDLEVLVTGLLRDLPGYANRVIQRSYDLVETDREPGYVVLAGRPEFAPLSLGPESTLITDSADTEVRQVFLTTLERQYLADGPSALQNYHWLFFAFGDQTWKLAFMYSAIGDYPQNGPVAPPYNSSEGAIAQAVRLWLRDCEAGAVEEIE